MDFKHTHGNREHEHAHPDIVHSHMLREICSRVECSEFPTHNIHPSSLGENYRNVMTAPLTLSEEDQERVAELLTNPANKDLLEDINRKATERALREATPRPLEDFVIPDLTEEERDSFLAALDRHESQM